MMNILLIDTSKRQAQVGCIKDGEVIAQRSWESTHQLGIDLLQQIDELAGEVEGFLPNVDRVAVHRGPGHFSALRAGIVTATMLAEAWGAELVAVASSTADSQIEEAMTGDPAFVVEPVYMEG